MYNLSIYTLSLSPCGIQKNPGFTVPHLVRKLVMQVSNFLMKIGLSAFSFTPPSDVLLKEELL
jgi:hypothetical protein